MFKLLNCLITYSCISTVLMFSPHLKAQQQVNPSLKGQYSLPVLPSPPAQVKKVTDFGAVPDDGQDDLEALQRAVNSLKTGEWLVFPKGVYHQSKSLWVRNAGVTLWGEGARIHATNPKDQSILLAESDISLYGFTLTAVTEKRGDTPWQSRISIFANVQRTEPLKNNVVRNNKVIAQGAPGSPEANSATAAGIFVYRAQGFLIAENTVQRSLADGIHVTAGSHNGSVIGNTVRENGDDMVAVVSYMRNKRERDDPISTIAQTLNQRKSLNLVRNVIIANNDLSGQYWGRGISVVGGHDVTIKNNVINRTTMAAGIYLAREPGYMTFGLNNVLVEGNTIRHVQTSIPDYLPQGFGIRKKAGHGGIEVYTHIRMEEKMSGSVASELAISSVAIVNNIIEDTLGDAIRVGHTAKKNINFDTAQRSNEDVALSSTLWKLDQITIKSNKMNKIGGQPIKIFQESENTEEQLPKVFCSANTVAGVPINNKLCSLTKESVVSGANISTMNK